MASVGEKELETLWQIADLVVRLLPTSSGGFGLRTGRSAIPARSAGTLCAVWLAA
jgi:hypothetical protein